MDISSSNSITLSECRLLLSEIIRTAERPREKLAALDRLAKISGWYRPKAPLSLPEEDADLLNLFDLSDGDYHRLIEILGPTLLKKSSP